MSNEKVLTTQEKYYNYYVETLTQTLNQQVLSNVSLQANVKVNSELHEDLKKQFTEIQENFEKNNFKNAALEKEWQQQIEQIKADSLSTQSNREQQKAGEIVNLKNIISNKDKDIGDKNNEIVQLKQFKDEYEKVKQQLAHLDTFRNELVKTQELVKTKDVELKKVVSDKDSLIDELNKKIEYLQLTPAQRKKFDTKSGKKTTEDNSVIPLVVKTIEVSNNTISPTKARIIKQTLPGQIVRDGGSF